MHRIPRYIQTAGDSPGWAEVDQFDCPQIGNILNAMLPKYFDGSEHGLVMQKISSDHQVDAGSAF